MSTKLYLHDNEVISGFKGMNDTQGAGIDTARVSTQASGTDIQWTDVEGGTVVAWVSPPSPVGGWTLAGSIGFNIWADESDVSANCKARARIYRRDTGGILHEIGVGPFDDNVEIGITPGVFTWNPLTIGETFAEDERLVVKFYITNIGTMGGGQFCELNYDGATPGANGDSYVELVENVTFKSEPGPSTPTNLTSSSNGRTRTPFSGIYQSAPVGSGRYRTVGSRGGGNIGGVPLPSEEIISVLLAWQTEVGGVWYGSTVLNFNGISGVTCDFTLQTRQQQTLDGGGFVVEQWEEYRVLLHLYGLGTHIIEGDWSGHQQIYPVNEPKPNLNLLEYISGSWGVECVQRYIEIHDENDLYEKSYILQFRLSGSISVVLPIIVGEEVIDRVTVSASGTWELPEPQTPDDASNAGYGVIQSFSRLNPGYPLRTSLELSHAPLRCLRAPFASQDGNVSLSGDGHSGSLSCGETIIDNPPDFHYWKIVPPFATIQASPSWAIDLETRGYNYEDAALEPYTVDWTIFGQYRNGNGLLRTFNPIELSSTSILVGGAARYPSTGWIQFFVTNVSDGQASLYKQAAFPGFPDTLVNTYAGITDGIQSGLVNEPWSLFAPDLSDQVGTLPDGRLDVSTVGPYVHKLVPDHLWLDSFGSYYDSYHHPFWAKPGMDNEPAEISKYLPVLMGPRFRQGQIKFPSTHQFDLMTNSSYWFNGGNCSISTVGDGVEFVASASNAIARTINNSGVSLYKLKSFAFRYLRLRIKSSLAGSNFRVYVGAILSPPTPLWAKYRWDFTISGSGAYETIIIDLAQPDYVGSYNFDTSTGTWTAADRVYHGDEIFYPSGQQVWLYFEDAATYTVDYLEGYVDTTGTRNYPALLFHPLDGKGGYSEPLEYYEPNTNWFRGAEMNMRAAINGSRVFTTIPSQFGGASFASLWAELYQTLDDFPNDTGITVLGEEDDTRVNRSWLFNSELQEAHDDNGFGLPITLDTFLTRYAQQIGPFPHGYYGMGKAWGSSPSYGNEIEFRTEWIFGGEAIGIVPGYTAGNSLELRDNDTEVVIDTSDPDDDGTFRLFSKYGVVRPRGNLINVPEYTETLVPLGGPPPTFSISYTVLGKILNSYWLWGDQLSDIDGSGYARTPDWTNLQNRNERLDVPILDRYQTWLILPFEEVNVGTDITSSLSDLHIVYKDRGKLFHARNPDRGKSTSWEENLISIFMAGDAVPTITCDERNHLWVGFHDINKHSHIIRSKDLGDNWEIMASFAGRKWPRIAATLGAVWVAVMNDYDLEIYMAGIDAPVLVTTIPDVEPGLVSFESDYRNRHILEYVTDGNVVQRINQWDSIGSPNLVAAASGRKNLVAVYPSFGYTHGRRFYWTPSNLLVSLTDSTFETESSVDGSITPTFGIQWIGACIDLFGHWWAIGQLANGILQLFNSIDGGQTFSAVS